MAGHSRSVTLRTDDDWRLAATLFTGPGDGPLVLVQGGTAVPRTFYTHWAQHMIAAGARAVLTYDYRGVAGSAGDRSRWRSLRLKDWALRDMPTAVTYLRGVAPDAPLVGVGHSFGGQAIGLCDCAHHFDRFAAVATMSGYWRALDNAKTIWLRTQVNGRLLAYTLGRVPGWTGIGQTLPAGIYLDWARWILSPDYFFSDPELPGARGYMRVALPFLNVAATDDPWCNAATNLALMRHYAAADVREVWLEPTATARIGHLGFFRRANAQHWPMLANFLLHGAWNGAEALGTRAAQLSAVPRAAAAQAASSSRSPSSSR